jgi:two-component system sensor histidine kinase PilS (NtrC family)
MPALLLYDLLLTSYLVYLTGVDSSIFLFLYLLNIAFASVAYQLQGALLVALLSGLTFFFIYCANNDMELLDSWYNLFWHQLLFLLTALLCGQFMDELKKQKILLASQQESIKRLEIMNDRLLNSIPMGILLVDENEYVQKVNQTALSVLNLGQVPEMQLKYYELLPELKGILQAWGSMTETQKLRFVFRPQGGGAHLSLRLVTLPGKETKQHIFALQDVSKLKELEDRLEFESKLAATGELAAGIAHEIRNPLASISGSIELLSQSISSVDRQDKRLVEIALTEIKRLNRLVTDFLEFAKPKDSVSEDFSLREVVSEVAEAMLSRPSGERLHVTNDIPFGLHAHANKERMKQVFFNLFINSIEATEKKVSIRITAEPAKEGIVEFLVSDDGPGIAADLMDRVFDPFFTTKSEGTGLGLATVAQIMRAAHGQIQLEPSLSGTTFRLALPASSTMEIANSAS